MKQVLGTAGLACSLLPATFFLCMFSSCKDEQEQPKAAPGEGQTGHEEKYLYHEGGETLAQAS